MYKNLLSSLLTIGIILVPSSVLSSSYDPVKYPLSRSCSSRHKCLIKSSPLKDEGFPHFDASFLDYFYYLARSNKVTSKGYPYRACNYKIELSAQVEIYFPRDKYKSENWGVYDTVDIHYKSDGNLSSGFSPLNYKVLDDTVENYSLGATVMSPRRNYFEYGCDTVPIDVEPSNTCPNLVIRGLPFIRNTITCHQKNR